MPQSIVEAEVVVSVEFGEASIGVGGSTETESLAGAVSLTTTVSLVVPSSQT
jgi:hypothetical protein